MKHKHRAIPLHSQKQAAMFFALANQLNFNTEEVKIRATRKYKHECFNELLSSEINELIDILSIKVEKQNELKKCYQCGKLCRGYFCSDECKNKYYPPEKRRPTINEMRDKLAEMGRRKDVTDAGS